MLGPERRILTGKRIGNYRGSLGVASRAISWRFTSSSHEGEDNNQYPIYGGYHPHQCDLQAAAVCDQRPKDKHNRYRRNAEEKALMDPPRFGGASCAIGVDEGRWRRFSRYKMEPPIEVSLTEVSALPRMTWWVLRQFIHQPSMSSLAVSSSFISVWPWRSEG
jgi:hypothetical protein